MMPQILASHTPVGKTLPENQLGLSPGGVILPFNSVEVLPRWELYALNPVHILPRWDFRAWESVGTLPQRVKPSPEFGSYFTPVGYGVSEIQGGFYPGGLDVNVEEGDMW